MSQVYEFTLKYTNQLLEALGKEPITDLTQFYGVFKRDLNKDECRQIALDMEDDIYHFIPLDKNSSLYKNRKVVKKYAFDILNELCKLCGYCIKRRNIHTRKIKQSVLIDIFKN